MAILSYLTDLEIYTKYIDNQPGGFEVGKAMLSPLRTEKTPSFGLFIGRSGEICFKDHLLGGGDCIRFVQMKLGLTYFDALSQIATDFDLTEGYICKRMTPILGNEDRLKDFTTREEVLSKVTPFFLGKKRRSWALHDIMYWRSFGISVSTLEHYNVSPVEYIFLNGKPHKADKYAYCFMEMKDKEETYKIYQPFNEKFKWINGHTDAVWQGWAQLPEKGEVLIVTKSLKDVMSIYEVTGYPAVSLQSENVLPKEHVFQQLKERFDVGFLLYDNDFDKDTNWGMIFGERIVDKYSGIQSVYIPDRYRCKDFSDLVKSIGVEKAKKVLEDMLKLPF